MENENLIIEIDGAEAGDLYPRLISLEVEHDIELASMFRMQFSLLLDQGGSWGILDDERLRIWKQVSIRAGLAEADEVLITGYITHVRPLFDDDPARCLLEVWGMDAGVLMDRQEKLKDWPNKKDSDIASEIIASYGLVPDVEDTEVIHDEALSTIIQRETDLRFLQRLALRNGFACYVEGETACFKKPRLDEPPQPVLSVHFGSETTVNHLKLAVNALSPANVAMFQIDRASKEVLEAEAAASEQTALGAADAQSLLGPGLDPAQVFVSRTAATGTPEMTTLCRELYHQGEWFVEGEGETTGNQYGHVLKARQTVAIRGIGETYSGVYYVSHVTHVFSDDGYRQIFKVRRNALLPSGSEDFSSTSAAGLI
ncbi:MAG: contractile injection system protein, VgrG/Pvc8 family [Thermodesulfobacteriota bacterium]